MMSRVVSAACAFICAAVAIAPLPARADFSEAGAIRAGLLQPANAELQRIVQENKEYKEDASRDAQTVAQANPVGTPQRPLRKPGLPGGFTYNLDYNIAWPTNNPGFNVNTPGGMDAGVGYGFSRTNRAQVGYYEIQQVPLGFSNVTVPFYLQGLTGPGSVPVQTANTGVVDVTTKDKILTVVDQNLFELGKLPVVISPSYLAHWAYVFSCGKCDTANYEFGGFPTSSHLRTEQEWLLPVTLPFLATPRMFGTMTFAPQWLVHPAGVNQTNHVQLFYLAYLEYHASKSTTFFVQPSRLIIYDPDFAYPQHTPTLIYGLSHHFTKRTYMQWTVLTGGPSNYNQLGITSLTCQALPCAPSQVYPSFGGLKATTVQLQFGIGSPTVIPL